MKHNEDFHSHTKIPYLIIFWGSTDEILPHTLWLEPTLTNSEVEAVA